MAITPRRASTTGPARRSSERKSFKISPAGAPMRAPVMAARAFMGRNPAILEGADPDPIARAAQPSGQGKLGAWLNRHYDVADSLLGERMAKIINRRVCAELDGPFVVFIIGARLNKPWK